MDAKQLHDLGQQLRVDAVHAAAAVMDDDELFSFGALGSRLEAARALAGDRVAR